MPERFPAAYHAALGGSVRDDGLGKQFVGFELLHSGTGAVRGLWIQALVGGVSDMSLILIPDTAVGFYMVPNIPKLAKSGGTSPSAAYPQGKILHGPQLGTAHSTEASKGFVVTLEGSAGASNGP